MPDERIDPKVIEAAEVGYEYVRCDLESDLPHNHGDCLEAAIRAADRERGLREEQRVVRTGLRKSVLHSRLISNWRRLDPKALDLIAAERKRQIDEEGWTPEHDDQHTVGELRQAAVCYLRDVGGRGSNAPMPNGWPWQQRHWKPSDDLVRNLVKAAALLVAEIERLQRASEPEESASE